jgi:hypothetical protein
MERLTSGGLHEVLDRVGPAISQGSVNVISVVAIRDGSGERWSRKREQVEDFVERAFARSNPGGGLIVALNDIEFLAIHADTSRWAALSLSAAILKETLTFFVGEAAREDVRVMQVTGFADGELAVAPVDLGRLAASAEDVWGQGSRDHSVPPSEAIDSVTKSVRLVSGELEVEATHRAKPTWNVKDKVVTSFLVETCTTPVATAALPPLLASEVARSSLAFAAHHMGAGCDGGEPIAMHVPVPLSALALTAGRYPLLHVLRDLSPDVRRLLVLELTDVPDGVPQSRLAEAVSMLAPHARAVLARAPSDGADLLQWRRCGLHGITLDCSMLDAADRSVLTRLGAFARSALAMAPACVGYSLDAMSLLVSAWGAGFTHLGGAAVTTEVTRLAAIRLPSRDLYRRAPQAA